MASDKIKHNSLNKLKDDSGVWRECGHGLDSLIMEYFSTLFKSTVGDSSVILEAVTPCVSQCQNDLLTQPFTDEEIHTATFSMHSDKSSGRTT